MTSPSLPPHIVAALSTPSQRSWETIADWLECVADNADGALMRVVKQQLVAWPREIPRQPPKRWIGMEHAKLKTLAAYCLNVTEVSTYNLYITALSVEPRLKLRDGSDAVSLHRQQRGVVETATGKKLAMNGDVPGMADLGGTLTVEWCSPARRLGQEVEIFCVPCMTRTAATFVRHCGDVLARCETCYHIASPQRLQLYIELEIKLDGKIPPQAREYEGTSRRQLTDTERQQVQRQQAQLARGGCYIFADRVVDAVEAVVRYRDEVLVRIGA